MKESLLDVMKWGLILVIAGAVVGILTHFSQFGILALWITALATAVIAYHAVASQLLNQKIKERDEEFRQQVSDMYQAIVVSNVVSPAQSDTSKAIDRFRELYKGKTKIFD